MAHAPSTGTSPNGTGAAPLESQPLQVALRLRPAERSDRAIVSNVSAVHAGSGLVFMDFGFIEQQAIDEVTRAMRANAQTPANIDGRLECRIAMSPGDVAQLARQLQQILGAGLKSPANETASDDTALRRDPEARLQ